MRTHLYMLSTAVILGNFQPLKDWVSKNIGYRRYLLYGGVGMDYVNVEYSTEERIVSRRFGHAMTNVDNQKYNLHGYWGTSVFAGIGYLNSFGKFYVETGYTKWLNEDWGNSYPTRIGFSIYF